MFNIIINIEEANQMVVKILGDVDVAFYKRDRVLRAKYLSVNYIT